MASWPKLCCFGMLLTTVGKSAESALAFTRSPDNPTYVIEGHHVSLQWDYSVDDRQNELDYIVWSVFDKNDTRAFPLFIEYTNGIRELSPALPRAYKGRVHIEGPATLIIYNVTVNDAVQFKCLLSAKTGSNATDQDSAIKLSVKVPPKVTPVKPEVKYGHVDDSIAFTCNANGKPPPIITWHRGNIEVSGGRYSIMSVSPGSSQLTIKRVSHADDGYYVCRASSNGMESANAKCYLRVVKGMEEDNKSCSKRRYEVQKGENVTLCCPVSAQPSPEVEWAFKGVKIGKFLSTVLFVPNINETNYGSYNCTARDLAGTSKTFVITLNEETQADSFEVKREGSNTLKWDDFTDATDYVVRLLYNKTGEVISILSQQPKVEIVHSSVKSKSGKPFPSKVRFNVTVLAIKGEKIIGKGYLGEFEPSGAVLLGFNFRTIFSFFVVVWCI